MALLLGVGAAITIGGLYKYLTYQPSLTKSTTVVHGIKRNVLTDEVAGQIKPRVEEPEIEMLEPTGGDLVLIDSNSGVVTAEDIMEFTYKNRDVIAELTQKLTRPIPSVAASLKKQITEKAWTLKSVITNDRSNPVINGLMFAISNCRPQLRPTEVKSFVKDNSFAENLQTGATRLRHSSIQKFEPKVSEFERELKRRVQSA